MHLKRILRVEEYKIKKEFYRTKKKTRLLYLTISSHTLNLSFFNYFRGGNKLDDNDEGLKV